MKRRRRCKRGHDSTKQSVEPRTQPQSDLDLCSHLNTHSRVGDITDVCGRGREREGTMSENVITIITTTTITWVPKTTHLVVVEVGEARHGRAEQKQVAVRDGAHPLVVCARYHG